MDEEALEERVRAVERALNEEGPAEAGPPETRERLAALEDRVQDLEAATEALRGYVGDVRARDERADRADRRTDTDLATAGRDPPRTDPDAGRSPTGPRGGGDRMPVQTAPPRRGGEEAEDGLLDRIAAWL